MRGPGSRLPPPIGHKLRAGRKDNLHKNSTKGIALYRIRESGMQCFSIAQVWNHRSKGRLSINVFLWNAGIRALVYHFDGIAKTSVCLLTHRVAEIWLSGTWNFGSCTPISKSIFFLLTSGLSIVLIALQFLDDVPIQMLGSDGQLLMFAHLF